MGCGTGITDYLSAVNGFTQLPLVTVVTRTDGTTMCEPTVRRHSDGVVCGGLTVEAAGTVGTAGTAGTGRLVTVIVVRSNRCHGGEEL